MLATIGDGDDVLLVGSGYVSQGDSEGAWLLAYDVMCRSPSSQPRLLDMGVQYRDGEGWEIM